MTFVQVKGILGVHDVHIWQLSDITLVASMHVLVHCAAANHGQEYEEITNQVRIRLHKYGIHSATIQLEIYRPQTEYASNADDVDTPNRSGRDCVSSAKLQGNQDLSNEKCLYRCVGEKLCQDRMCCETISRGE